VNVWDFLDFKRSY